MSSPRQRHRRLLALAAGVLFVLLLAFVWRPWRRSVGFQDADLAPHPRPAVAAESNAAVLLDRAAGLLPLEKTAIGDLNPEILATNPVSPATRTLLDAAAPAIEAFWKSAEAPAAALLAPSSRLYSNSFPDPDPWRTLAGLAQLQVRVDADAGRTAIALERALALARLSHRLEDAGGSTSDTIRGRAFRERALRELQRDAARFDPADPALVRAVAALLALRCNREGLSNVVRFEYRETLAYFEAIKAGRPPGTSNRFSIRLPNLLVDTNRARLREATLSRFALAHLDAPLAAVPFAELAPWRTTNSTFRRLMRGDAFGDILGQFQVGATERLLHDRAAIDARVVLTATLLALRAHEARGQGLPVALAELVPEFLPSAPLDPFDGRPLRFARDRRLLWAIGRDLVDDQGRKRGKDPNATFDQVVEIPW